VSKLLIRNKINASMCVAILLKIRGDNGENIAGTSSLQNGQTAWSSVVVV
jgi:hypothetical protein